MKANQAGVSILTGRREKLTEVALTSPIRILVVEEQNVFRDGLAKLLSEQDDLEVVGSTDSLPVATEHLRTFRPDVALLGWPASSPNSQRIFALIQEAKAPTRIIMLVREDVK